MNPSKVELAVLNNTRWYEAMFAAHGLASETDARVWRSNETPPPFHSNLVVLAPTTTHEEIEAYATDIESNRRRSGWSLKDSYAVLNLASLGCSMLFDAEWIWREPSPRDGSSFKSLLTWIKIDTPSGLTEWENAWSGDTKNESALPKSTQFPASLLESPDHAFYAGLLEGKVRAGGIANRSQGVVGMSNIFSPPEFREDTWKALVASVSAGFPLTPIVGYERDDDLKIAKTAGFSAIGKLRVWCWQT
jgi:hypothetical protein